MKHRLVFDASDANTIADSDSVGAYIRSSDGTLIDSVTISGVDRLAVDSTMKDGAGNSITSTSGALDVNIASGSLDVNLTQADEITVFQGTSPWVVSATDLDIRDLNAAQDSVDSWLNDGSGNPINSTTGALNVYITGSGPLTINDAALANTAIAHAKNLLDVADTAENLVASPLANRKYLYVYNNDNRMMYIGASGVNAATGFPLNPGALMELRAGAAIDIEFVSSKLNHDARTLELS